MNNVLTAHNYIRIGQLFHDTQGLKKFQELQKKSFRVAGTFVTSEWEQVARTLQIQDPKTFDLLADIVLNG